MDWLLVSMVCFDCIGLIMITLGWSSPKWRQGWGHGESGIDDDPDLDKNLAEDQLQQEFDSIVAEMQGKEFQRRNLAKPKSALLVWSRRNTRSYWQQPNRIKQDICRVTLIIAFILTTIWSLNNV